MHSRGSIRLLLTLPTRIFIVLTQGKQEHYKSASGLGIWSMLRPEIEHRVTTDLSISCPEGMNTPAAPPPRTRSVHSNHTDIGVHSEDVHHPLLASRFRAKDCVQLWNGLQHPYAATNHYYHNHHVDTGVQPKAVYESSIEVQEERPYTALEWTPVPTRTQARRPSMQTGILSNTHTAECGEKQRWCEKEGHCARFNRALERQTLTLKQHGWRLGLT